MDKKQWLKIETILDEALSLENLKRRKEFVRDACENNEQLFRQVIALLQSIKEADKMNFLERE